MENHTVPLDERTWSEPVRNQWYMGQLPNSEFRFPFMGENMLHHYFSGSDFFDWTTTNGLRIKQSQVDPVLWQDAHNRKKFEEQIASRNGTEYMIVEGEGMQFDSEGQPVKGGVWVIRKQERSNDGLETLGTYYIIGERIYQAPSVGDVLGTRLLSASTALSKCFSQAATLPRWTPTTGHTYPTTSASASKHHGAETTTAGTTPAASTPGFDREPSLAAESRASSSAPAGVSSSNATAASADAFANMLLRDSMQKSFTYGEDPFTDENPLQGEPGNLNFATSTAAAKKRKADAEAAATKAKEEAVLAAAAAAAASAAAREAAAASKPATPVAASPTTPGGKVGKKVKKDKKRRKSKHDAHSPPMSPATGGTPFGGTPAATPGPAVG